MQLAEGTYGRKNCYEKVDVGVQEYQYHLKDHLGNVRVTFTTKDEVDSATATMETSQVTEEQSQFLYYDEAVKINFPLFNHTQGDTTYYTNRLMGADSLQQFGLAKSLSVMPGDTIRTWVFAKYLDTDDGNWTTALTNFIGILTGGSAPPGTIVDGGFTGTTGGEIPWNAGMLNTDKSGETGDAPMAFLNWLVFDREYNFLDGGYERISENAKEDGTGVPFDSLGAEIPITQAGYVYVYLSNDSQTPVETYWDDLTVEHVKSPIIAMNDYYPFGMQTANSYVRENSVQQNYLYNGKELQDELDLGWLDYGARMYQPDLGRFFTQDRFAEKYFNFSTYQYAANNPSLFIDVNGDSILINFKKDKIIYHDGNLTYAGTNKKYEGKVNKNGQLKGFVGRTARSLDQIRTGGPVGQGLVDDLQNDSRNIQISQAKENSTTGLKVDWNPSNTSGGLDTRGSTDRPAYIGLAHELAHANDLLQDGIVDYNKWFNTTDGQRRTNAEIYATHVENQIRSENGLNIREYYTQIPFADARITAGNTSLHIKQTVNLSPVRIKSLLGTITFTPTIQAPYKY